MSVHWPVLVSCPLILLLTFVAVVRTALVVVTVEEQSMSPSLLDGDRVLVVRGWPARWLRKGQIAIVAPGPRATAWRRPFGQAVPFIKRIVGLPGDTLVTSLAELDGEYDRHESARDAGKSQHTWHILPGHCFVRGDNPSASLDSRSWGPIPFRNVLGVVVMKLPRKMTSIRPPATPITQFAPKPAPTPGQPAPAFTAETLRGETVTLTSYAGRAVAFLFILPSMSDREVVPQLEALRPKAERSGVELVLVSTADPGQTQRFADDLSIRSPVLVAPYQSNPFLNDYTDGGTPAYCLIDAQGTIQSSGYPSLEWGEWKALAESWG